MPVVGSTFVSEPSPTLMPTVTNLHYERQSSHIFDQLCCISAAALPLPQYWLNLSNGEEKDHVSFLFRVRQQLPGRAEEEEDVVNLQFV